MRHSRVILLAGLTFFVFLLGSQIVFAAAPAYVHDQVMDRVRESGRARVVVSMWDRALPEARAADWRARGPAIRELARRVTASSPGFEVVRRYETQPLLAGYVDEAALRQLMSSAAVEGVYLDRVVYTALNDSGPLIGQPEAQTAGYDGDGICIAILDTGIDYNHVDLGGSGAPTEPIDFPNSKVVGGIDIVNNDADPLDDEGHGTEVAGVAAGEGVLYRGVAPGATLVAVKVLNSEGTGYSSDVTSGIEWCITNRATYNIKAINLSLSDYEEWSDPEAQCDNDAQALAIVDAVAAGMVVVAAAGNSGYLGGIGYPACVSAATAVGATYDRSYLSNITYLGCSDTSPPVNSIGCFSNRGELLDLYAPGTLITTTARGGGYISGAGLAGTSYAAPHVAGAVAVLADMGVTTPAAIESLLARSGLQIVDPDTDVATPRIDLVEAMDPPTTGPDLVVTVISGPSTVVVGDPVTVGLQVKNQGDTASGACTAIVVLSANRVASPYDPVLATVSVPALAADQVFTNNSVAGTIPSVSPGDHHLGAYADSSYAIGEQDETNNAKVGDTVDVSGLTSRVVSNNIPAFMLKGHTYTISVSMQNDGTVPWTTAEGFELAAVSPEDTMRWGVNRVPLPGGSINPGGAVTFIFNVTAPADPEWYPCHWQMVGREEFLGEVATGGTNTLVLNDATFGQDYPAVSGDRTAYMDYSGLYGASEIPAISVRHLTAGTTLKLPENIPLPTAWDPQSETYIPLPPYENFDVSYHYYPDISGPWVVWQVDDLPDELYWYWQITAYNVDTPDVLPLRITYDTENPWDAAWPSIDGNLVVWEDYRNDPDGLMGDDDFLADNPDIYICDVTDVTGPGDHFPPVYALCTAPGPQFAPRISGNLVVWEDWRDDIGWQSDIYLYDLSVDSDDDGTPNWKDPDRPNPDPAEQPLGNTWWYEQYPDISGDTVVWMDLWRDPGTGELVDIYSLDLDSMVETAVATDPQTFRYHPRVDQRKVVWQDSRHGQGDIYWADLDTGVTAAIAAGGAGEYVPDISGRRVVYSRYRTTTPSDAWPVYNVYAQRLLTNGSVGVHTFTDVTTDHWAWQYIEAAAATGTVQGYLETGAYEPSWPVSRDQMAVFVARALAGGDGSVPAGPLEPTFDDVDTGYWAYKYIEYCADPARDVVQGFAEDNTYRPLLTVNRGAMAVFVGRAMAGGDSFFDTYDPPATPTFADVTSSNDWAWCHKYVEYIKAYEVTAGYPDGLYHPDYWCSRDQMAVYISRAFGYLP